MMKIKVQFKVSMNGYDLIAEKEFDDVDDILGFKQDMIKN